jgi:hypothetical protein
MTEEHPPAIDFTPAPALGDGFDFPQEVDDATIAFPATVMHLMPVMEAIPEDYPRKYEWQDFITQWFFFGWEKATTKYWLYTHPEIDGNKAIRHIRAVIGSYEPKHQHKEAATAWLMSRWFGGIRPR